MEQIFRSHDRSGDGTTVGNYLHVGTLGYADDVAFLERGNQEGITRLSERVTSIKVGSEKDADMKISIPKTKSLHVHKQDPVTPTTHEEAKATCKFKCPHPGCNHTFLTKRGLSIHAGRCQWQNEFVIEKILEHKGDLVKRQFKIR